MPMPSVTDLQTMYGSWNPQAYLTAQDNAGLERQFRESEYGRQQELTKQAGLDTVFRQQDDPNRVQERVLTNRARELGNTGLEQGIESKGMQLERDRAMQQFNLNADQRKALMQVTEDELKQADQVIEQLRRSLDPADQDRGQKLYEFTGAARALKQKQAAEMAKEKFKEDEAMKRAKLQAGTSVQVANIGAAARTAAAGSRGSTASPVALLSKLSPDKRLAPVRAILDSNIDPETKEPLTSAARAYYESMYDQDVRTQDAKGPMVPQQPVLDATTKQLVAPTPRPSVGGGTTATRQSSGPVAPAVGEVRKGYKYLGGDPSNPKSWSKV